MILKAEKERQSELLEKLTTDNSRLISQVSGTTYGMCTVILFSWCWLCVQVERFRVASEKVEGELSEAKLEHDRMAASLALAQLTATELEKVGTDIGVHTHVAVCSMNFIKLCLLTF